MKFLQSTLLLSLCFLIMNDLMAQRSGVITYSETSHFKIEMDNVPAGIDLSEMMPTERTTKKQLVFDNDISAYIDNKEDAGEKELNSDDGSIQIVIMESDVKSNLYIDHKKKTCLDQQGFMGKQFVINKPLNKIKWKITNEKIKYLDYECMKATMTDETGVEIVAWFAPAIPVKVGPGEYGQLPGAILLLSKGDKEMEIKATNIELKEIDEVEVPSEGKKVTQEEYEKIVEEKLEEMKKQYGGNTISIRG